MTDYAAFSKYDVVKTEQYAHCLPCFTCSLQAHTHLRFRILDFLTKLIDITAIIAMTIMTEAVMWFLKHSQRHDWQGVPEKYIVPGHCSCLA